MIVHKMWTATKGRAYYAKSWRREGWYLFGVVPLLIRDVTARP